MTHTGLYVSEKNTLTVISTEVRGCFVIAAHPILTNSYTHLLVRVRQS